MAETVPVAPLSECDLLKLELDLAVLSAKRKWWEPPKVDGEEPDMDPANFEHWGRDRTIPADVIRSLAVGGGELCPWPAGVEPLLVTGARISGELNLRGVTLKRGIWLEKCGFEQLVQLSDSTTKTVSFLGSYLSKGLRAKRATIKGSLYLNDGFVAADEVNLEDVSIDGNLECSGGKFNNKTHAEGKFALVADNAKIGGDVRLYVAKVAGPVVTQEVGFEAWGEVRFSGATVAGDFDCTGGSFRNGQESAIKADGLSCRNLYLRKGFLAEGAVNFIGVQTEGQVICIGGTFSNEGKLALRLRFGEVGSSLLFESASNLGENSDPASIKGLLDLSQAKCRIYRDTKKAWPTNGNLLLDGFTYERFDDCDTTWQVRRDWLLRQYPDNRHPEKPFCPQPWTQAAKVLRDMGHDAEAQELAYQRESARMKSRTHVGIWSRMLHIAIGSGYKPFRPLYFSFVYFIFAWFIFACAANLGFMAPRESSVQIYLAGDPTHRLPKDYTRFNAPLYALDVYLPIIELGQDKAWEPSDIQSGHRRNTHDDLRTERIRQELGHDWRVTGARANEVNTGLGIVDYLAKFMAWMFSLGVHRLAYWTTEIFGWISISLLIAVFGGIIKRE